MAQDDVISRVMPHSLEAERSVLGSMLIDPEAVEIAAEIIKEIMDEAEPILKGAAKWVE